DSTGGGVLSAIVPFILAPVVEVTRKSGYSLTKGNSHDKSVRCPEATTLPASTAWCHAARPVTNASHVAESVSMTAGGVPRVCTVPSMIWVTPNGGMRTSTDRPGASAASSSSEYRTAVARTFLPAAAGSAAHCRTAATPLVTSIFLRATNASGLAQQSQYRRAQFDTAHPLVATINGRRNMFDNVAHGLQCNGVRCILGQQHQCNKM